MLNAKATQFSLSPDGHILWQEKLNNPLPGIPVAKLVKGDHPLRPKVEVLEIEATAAHDRQTLQNTLNIWLNGKMETVLEALMLLGMPGGDAADPVTVISAKVFDALGIVSREDIEEEIKKLDLEKRAALRAKKIRLGPVLVFIPALVKPAAVELRAFLWSLFYEKPLPQKMPANGIVSMRIEEENPDKGFFRAIGYPVYGKRSLRIDMLDRVINMIYETAKHGKFEARLQMAEWLGCSVPELYAILTDMGHVMTDEGEYPLTGKVKAEKPAAVAAPVVEEKIPDAEQQPAETKAEEVAAVEKPADEVKKIQLATFRLKRGKNHEKREERKSSSSDTQGQDKKKFYKKDDKAKDKKHNDGGTPLKERDFKKKDRGDKRPKQDDRPRVISVHAKVRAEDSPFAILQKLKVNKDG